MEKDYEEHILNKALLSYDSRDSAESLAEYLAGEVIEMRRLEWLKGRVKEVLRKLTKEERDLVAARYFGEGERLLALRREGEKPWTERTYFRKQRRLGERLASLLTFSGVTEEVFWKDYASMEVFAKIRRCVEEGRDRKISAVERRWLS